MAEQKNSEYEMLLPQGLDYQSVSFLESIIQNIRDQLFDYSTRLVTIDLGTGQSIRDQLGVFSAQLVDMYGEVVTEHELMKVKYVHELRETHIRLWHTYQSDDPEINPDGKLAKGVAQDKARYQSQIDCYPLAKKIARLKGLEERCNGLWRYAIPKVLDSLASRIALTKEYPNGLPSTALAMSRRSESEFKNLFGDLEDDTTKAKDTLADIRSEYENDIAPDDSGYFDPNL